MGEVLMYLVDTNILIYHFNNNIPDHSREEINSIFKNHFNISVITKMEFLGFKGHTEESFSKARSFIDHADILGINSDVVDLVVSLRRKNAIKLPDAVIAATCITNNFTLVTRNTDDFENLELNLLNPFSTNPPGA